MMTLARVRRSLLVAATVVAGCFRSGRTSAPAPPPNANEAAPGNARLVIGHRGASGYAPEHTLASYDLALRLGADYIEQDLQLTKDGVLVALHDPTLDRTARGTPENCTGLVIEKTLAQIETCDVGSWFNDAFPQRARPEYVGQRIPTLEAIFQRYGRRANYYIETKNPEDAPGMEEKLLALLDTYGLLGSGVRPRQVLIQSFSATSLRKMHALDPALPLIQLTEHPTSAAVRAGFDSVAGYAIGIGPAKGTVDAALIEAAHSRCLDVHPYTVNDSTEMVALVAIGVDGLFTNFPDRLKAVVASASREAVAANRRGCRRTR